MPPRHLSAAAVCLILAPGPAFTAQARPIHFAIPAQLAASGVRAFARQAGLSLILASTAAQSRTTHAVKGDLDPRTALERLLTGTGLTIRSWDGDTVVLEVSPEEADTLPQVVVTGSHIARREMDSAMPVRILSLAEAGSFGYSTMQDALVLNPAVGPGLGDANSQGDTWDVGVSNINLRNMGVNRSLVLVDGRRWVSSGSRTSAVDLKTIPDAMIDRIEVVTGGAAAIYGADAVTGAVNIVTKKSLTGVHLSATTGISQQGDANETAFSLAAGTPFADGRGSLVIGGNYDRMAPLRDSDRFANRISFVANPANTGPHDGIPDNILDDDFRIMYRSAAPSFYYGGQWYTLQDGALLKTGYDHVNTSGELGNGHGGTGATGFENHFLRNRSQAGSLSTRASYALTSEVTWNVIASYGHSDTRGATVFPEVRDDVRPANWWGGTTGELATLSNPYLPDSLRQFMVANNLTSIPLDRSYFNLPEAFEYHHRTNLTFGTDIGGRLGGRGEWSAYLQYGQVVDDVDTTNMIRHSEWLTARDVIADPLTGQPECADAAARAAGCVPFNFFSTDAPSQAFLDYVEATRHEWRRNALYSAGGDIKGSLFSAPHEVSYVAGVEWRRETLSTRDDPDAAKLADIVFSPGGDYVLHPALDAARDTAELYGETVIPVIRDLPLARRLDVEGAYRFSHYSDSNPHTHTWKAGGIWGPVEGLTLRGVYSRSVRVPNFGELYAPQLKQTVGITSDPCSGVYITQNANRVANCAALLPGVSLPLPYPNTNAPVVYLGGNPHLTPETSRSFTVGGVFQPGFLPGFSLAVDYWNIRIDNVITALPYVSILELCVDSPSGIHNVYCDNLITRNPANGQIVSILASNYNLAAQLARGLDVDLGLRLGVGPGQLRIDLEATYLMEQTTVGSPETPGTDYAGQWNYPRLKATMMAGYDIGRFTIGLQTRFISRSVFSVTDASPETRDPNHVPAAVYNDLTVQFRPAERYSVALGVRNLGNVGIFGPLQDTAPGPNSSGGVQTGAAYYDAVGRYFFLKAEAQL